MRRPIIAANWKMNKNIQESVDFCAQFREEVGQLVDRDCVICPPFTSLWHVASALKGSDIALGAQNIFWESAGAYTGEVSADMLKDVGCQYVIIGHSERRKIFQESDQRVNQKAKFSIFSGLNPIICVGETLEEREGDKTFDVVQRQLKEGLKDVSQDDILKCVIAYEPVWAIGTGRNATPEQANEVHLYLRSLLEEIYDQNVSENIRIQYGGSVKDKNIDELMAQPHIDGALVGGASLDLKSFVRIVQFQVQEK